MQKNIIQGLSCHNCQSPITLTDEDTYECTKCTLEANSLSAFKKLKIPEKSQKVAFGLFRQQPLTNGIYEAYSKMVRDNDVVIIGLGSVGIEGVANNPYSAKQRTEMIRKLFGKNSKDKIKIIPLHDIGAKEKEEWVEYCMRQIDGKQLPTPTRYYAGSPTELDWFQDSKNMNGDLIELIDLKRHDTNFLSGSFIRQSISTGTDEWRSQVPECLESYIEDNYPEELTLEFHRNINRTSDPSNPTPSF